MKIKQKIHWDRFDIILKNKEINIFLDDSDFYYWEHPWKIKVLGFIPANHKQWNGGLLKKTKYHTLTLIKIPFIKKWLGINIDYFICQK